MRGMLAMNQVFETMDVMMKDNIKENISCALPKRWVRLYRRMFVSCLCAFFSINGEASDFSYVLNSIPVSQPSAPQTVLSGQSVSLGGVAEDSDGLVSKVFWRQVRGPQVSIADPTNLHTSFVAPTVTSGEIALIHLQLDVVDNQNASTSSPVMIQVQQNTLTMETIADKTVEENSALWFSVDAATTLGGAVSVSVSNLPMGAFFSGSEFFWVPSYSQAGIYSVTFTATNAQSAQVSETITVEVIDKNQAPQIETVTSVNTDETQLVSFSLTGSDADGQTTSLSMVSAPDGASFVNGVFSWVPGIYDAGVHDAIFIVSDGIDQRALTVPIYVQNLNQAPTLNLGAYLVVDERQVISLSSNAADIDGTVNQVQWSISGDAASLLSNLGETIELKLADVLDDTVVTVTAVVTDNEGLSTSESLAINIQHVNQLPTVEIAVTNSQVSSGDTVLATGLGSDNDGSIVSYQWSQLSGPAISIETPFAASTNILVGSIGIGDTIIFQLSVSDNDGGSGVASFSLSAGGQLTPINNTGKFARAFAIDNGDMYSFIAGATTDAANNAFVFGSFYGTKDFDFGPGEDIRVTSSSNKSGFITKISDKGTYEWTWLAQSPSGLFKSVYLNDAVADNSGNVYATGYFNSSVNLGSGYITGNGQAMFVVKISNQGELLWHRLFDGSSSEQGSAINLDSVGNVIVLGHTRSATMDFDPTDTGTDVRSLSSHQDLFVSKISNNGDYLWARRSGGVGQISYGNAHGMDLVVAASGDIFVATRVTATVGQLLDFAIDQGGHLVNVINSNDGYVFKLSTDGVFQWLWHPAQASSQAFVYKLATYENELTLYMNYKGTVDIDVLGSGDLVSSPYSFNRRIVVLNNVNGIQSYASNEFQLVPSSVEYDSQGNLYIGGGAASGDFDIGDGVDYRYAQSGRDLYLTKLDRNKNYQWTYFTGGSGLEDIKGIAPLANGSVWVGGTFYNSTTDFNADVDSFELTASGNDFFALMITGDQLSHLDSDGDTIPDSVETSVGMNPSDASDALGDMDGDMLTNVDEYRNGTLGVN